MMNYLTWHLEHHAAYLRAKLDAMLGPAPEPEPAPAGGCGWRARLSRADEREGRGRGRAVVGRPARQRRGRRLGVAVAVVAVGADLVVLGEVPAAERRVMLQRHLAHLHAMPLLPAVPLLRARFQVIYAVTLLRAGAAHLVGLRLSAKCFSQEIHPMGSGVVQTPSPT